jgi:glycerate dehydrogenase
MRAVFLDYSSLFPDDLDIRGLRALPLELALHDFTAPADTIARLRDADIVITNKVVIDRAVMDACPRLKLIAEIATGINNIDAVTAAERGIRIANVVGYGARAIAQHTLALMLALTNHLQEYTRDAVNGCWSHSPQVCLGDYPIRDLEGSTLGIIGYGGIGQAVQRLAEAFGMRVLIAEGVAGPAAGRLPLPELLAQADILTLHALLTPQTQGLINAPRLAQMKRGALLVNTARGGLLNEAAVIAALKSGQLRGAAVDVLSVEPPPIDHPMLAPDIPHLLITPHCAWVSRTIRQRLLDATVDNIRRFLAA